MPKARWGKRAKRTRRAHVRSMVRRELRGTVPTLADIASKMCVSTRTLQRRLTNGGVRFSDIVDSARKEVAEQYLARGEGSIADIAYQLGFADHSSFFRAFGRWTGTTPDTYRRASQSPIEAGPTTIEALRFLVVEDAVTLREATANHLRLLGAHRIELAANGREALQRLQHERIDVVLTGWDMPEMGGLELLRAIRDDDTLRKIPLIMVTAEAEHEKVQSAIASGVSDLLVKPYTSVRLKSKIVDSVQRASEQLPVFAEPPEPEASQPLTILVVDDAPDNLRLIAHLFEGQYRVRVANSGEKALAICSADAPPDLVLLDVMMPGMDGFEVAKRMREHPNSQLIPVIFVTALTSQEAWRSGLDLGAVDFVTKPIDPETLRIRVGNLMRYVAMHKQRQAEYDAMLAAARLREQVEEMMRHDLKDPLAGAIGIARQLAMDPALSSRQAKHAHLIQDTMVQLLNSVSMSSELFKIETGRYRLEQRPFALHEILEQTVHLARINFSSKQLDFDVCADASFRMSEVHGLGDPTLCQSVFHNLIKNACEAAPYNTPVGVSLFDETPLRVVIQNFGAVPPALRRMFFDRHTTGGKHDGVGIGTYSARLLVEAQGGTIAMSTSDEDDTTTVTVTLPRDDVDDGVYPALVVEQAH